MADIQKLEKEIEALKQQLAEEKSRGIKTEALAAIRTSHYRAHNPEQVYKLFFDGKLARNQTGQLVIQGALGQTTLTEAIRNAALDPESSHHFAREQDKQQSGPIVNPWKKGPDWNLTKQGLIKRDNAALAASLMAEAGVK